MYLARSGRIAVQAAMSSVVGWIVVVVWVWVGTWSIGTVRYPDAANWWKHYAAPRGAQALVVAVPLGAAVALLVGRILRRGAVTPDSGWPSNDGLDRGR